MFYQNTAIKISLFIINEFEKSYDRIIFKIKNIIDKIVFLNLIV